MEAQSQGEFSQQNKELSEVVAEASFRQEQTPVSSQAISYMI